MNWLSEDAEATGKGLKSSPAHIRYDDEEGDNSPSKVIQNEPRARGNTANNPLGDGATGKQRRRGRKRRARSMGRYPFIVTAKAYLKFVQPYMAASTFAVRRRGLGYLAHTFENLRAHGSVRTTNPARFEEAEIGALVAWMRERRLGLDYQAKLVVHLRALLTFIGNPILDRVKASKIVHLPNRAEKPIHVKDDAWYEDAMWRLEGLSNWGGMAIRFALACYYHTGLRVKELRLARLSDLDTARWTLTIEHPKGEGAWASAGERIAIFSSLRPHVLRYLDARARRLGDLGSGPEEVEALIPNDRGAYYSEAGWRRRRLKTFAEAGIGQANFRELRPTFAQRLKDRGAPIEMVSKALRHSSTATTERFYARIRSERAWLELERVWESSAPNSIPP